MCVCQLSIEESQVDEQGLDGHEPILTYTPDANAETGGAHALPNFLPFIYIYTYTYYIYLF